MSGPHQKVRDGLVAVINGELWDESLSSSYCGGPAGDASRFRPMEMPNGGSDNWPPMGWIGEARGGLGWKTFDMWCRCCLSPQVNQAGDPSSWQGLGNREFLSHYERWRLGALMLGSIRDVRTGPETWQPEEKTMDLARRVVGATVAALAIQAIPGAPSFVTAVLHNRDEDGKTGGPQIVPYRTLIDHPRDVPWVIAAQDRGVAKDGADLWPHTFPVNGSFLALALDWPGRGEWAPKAESADWWLWAMMKLSGRSWSDTWDPEWFGLTNSQRYMLMRLIESSGAECSGVILELGAGIPIRRKIEVKRWPGELLSWKPRSSNGNNAAILCAAAGDGEAAFWAPSYNTPGQASGGVDPGNAVDNGERRRVVMQPDDFDKGEPLASGEYPAAPPTLHVRWDADGPQILAGGSVPVEPPSPGTWEVVEVEGAYGATTWAEDGEAFHGLGASADEAKGAAVTAAQGAGRLVVVGST